MIRPLEYADRLASRSTAEITLVVMHCTELPDLPTAREYAERICYEKSQTGNSGHYYIDRDGTTHQYVTHDRVAHHVRGYNEASLGIELVNAGRYPDWWNSANQEPSEPYSDAQVASLIALLKSLQKSLPKLRRITGHEDLDRERVSASNDANQTVQRKIDPGPLFPWEEVLQSCSLERWRP